MTDITEVALEAAAHEVREAASNDGQVMDATADVSDLQAMIELDAAGYELTPAGATVHGNFTILEALQDGLRQQGWAVTEWGHVWTALTSVKVDDQQTAQQCLKLLDVLDSLDDVRSVSANLEIAPELEID